MNRAQKRLCEEIWRVLPFPPTDVKTFDEYKKFLFKTYAIQLDDFPVWIISYIEKHFEGQADESEEIMYGP